MKRWSGGHQGEMVNGPVEICVKFAPGESLPRPILVYTTYRERLKVGDHVRRLLAKTRLILRLDINKPKSARYVVFVVMPSCPGRRWPSFMLALCILISLPGTFPPRFLVERHS